MCRHASPIVRCALTLHVLTCHASRPLVHLLDRCTPLSTSRERYRLSILLRGNCWTGRMGRKPLGTATPVEHQCVDPRSGRPAVGGSAASLDDDSGHYVGIQKFYRLAYPPGEPQKVLGTTQGCGDGSGLYRPREWPQLIRRSASNMASAFASSFPAVSRCDRPGSSLFRKESG